MGSEKPTCGFIFTSKDTKMLLSFSLNHITEDSY